MRDKKTARDITNDLDGKPNDKTERTLNFPHMAFQRRAVPYTGSILRVVAELFPVLGEYLDLSNRGFPNEC